MRFTWIIKDGQLTGIAVLLCVVLGFAMAFGSIRYIDNYYVMTLCYSIGFAIAALGGYSGGSYALHLRPFGESSWRKAKRTYEENSDSDSGRSGGK